MIKTNPCYIFPNDVSVHFFNTNIMTQILLTTGLIVLLSCASVKSNMLTDGVKALGLGSHGAARSDADIDRQVSS